MELFDFVFDYQTQKRHTWPVRHAILNINKSIIVRKKIELPPVIDLYLEWGQTTRHGFFGFIFEDQTQKRHTWELMHAF